MPQREREREREREPKFGCKRKKLSSLIFFRESPEAYHDFFLPWLLSVCSFVFQTFPFVNSICIPFGDRKCLRFFICMPKGGAWRVPTPKDFSSVSMGASKSLFSLSLYIYTTLGSFHGKKRKDNK
jgi:hypothetical protein